MNGYSRRQFIVKGSQVAAGLSMSGYLLSACGGSEPSDRARTAIWEISEGRKRAPKLWNPFVPGFSNYDNGYSHWHEPFFILNYGTNKMEPWLGKSMESNKTFDEWTLVLQDGTKWNDGTPLTVDDVIFTINMLIDNAPDLLESDVLAQYVDDMTKVDDRTVKFKLKEPNPRFQLNLFSVDIAGHFPIVPEHVWKGQDPIMFQNYDPEKGWPLNSGPYTLTSAAPDRFEWARYDDWWAAKTGFKPLPQPEKMVWIAPGSNESRVSMMVNNEIDSLHDISLPLFEAMQAKNDKIVAWLPDKPYSWPDPCVRVLSVQHTVEPWNDADMRRALNFAIDRDQIVEIAYSGGTSPALTPFPDYETLRHYNDLIEQSGLIDKYSIDQHDPEQAQSLIESKGWQKQGDTYEKDGQQLSMELLASADLSEYLEISRVLVEQLQNVGINATVKQLASATYYEDEDLGKFEALVGDDACGSVVEPYTTLQRWDPNHVVPVGQPAGGLNYIRWSNEAYGAAVRKMGGLAIDDPALDDLFVNAMDIWYRELPMVPLTQAKKLISWNNTYWTNWPTSDNAYIEPAAWWDSMIEIVVAIEPA